MDDKRPDTFSGWIIFPRRAAPQSDWLLAGGIWNDAGVWDDSAMWID
jgi:hypothetical protein